MEPSPARSSPLTSAWTSQRSTTSPAKESKLDGLPPTGNIIHRSRLRRGPTRAVSLPVLAGGPCSTPSSSSGGTKRCTPAGGQEAAQPLLPGDLARLPRWSPAQRHLNEKGDSTTEAACTVWAEDRPTLLQRRRDFRRQVHDGCSFSSGQKRELVHGSAAQGDASVHWARERRKIADCHDRIQGAIRDCFRGRREIVGMQHMLAGLDRAPVVNEEADRRLAERLQRCREGLCNPLAFWQPESRPSSSRLRSA